VWSRQAAAAPGYTLTSSGSTGLSDLKDASGNVIAVTSHGSPDPSFGAITTITDNSDGTTSQVTYVPAGGGAPVTVTATKGRPLSGT
jgi:hypothetical protein